MRVIVEHLVEWRLAGETEVLGENLPQRHFVHHKSHLTRPRYYEVLSVFLFCGDTGRFPLNPASVAGTNKYETSFLYNW
jgi:hypothetical protein